MALLEQDNICCICEERAARHRIKGIPAYYCATCFRAHSPAIVANVPWVRFLTNGEKQRRKRRNGLLGDGLLRLPVYATGEGYA